MSKFSVNLLFLWILQLLKGKFEGFLKQLEVGEERLQSCNDLTAKLLRKKHPQSSAVRDIMHQLRYTHMYSTHLLGTLVLI